MTQNAFYWLDKGFEKTIDAKTGITIFIIANRRRKFQNNFVNECNGQLHAYQLFIVNNKLYVQVLLTFI